MKHFVLTLLVIITLCGFAYGQAAEKGSAPPQSQSTPAEQKAPEKPAPAATDQPVEIPREQVLRLNLLDSQERELQAERRVLLLQIFELAGVKSTEGEIIPGDGGRYFVRKRAPQPQAKPESKPTPPSQ